MDKDVNITDANNSDVNSDIKTDINTKNNQLTIYVDDVPYQVADDNNLLAAVLSKKLDLPYFCWHPSMGSVGACRQCAVTQYQNESDTRGRMVMSCMTPVVDGMRIGLKDKSSSKFREQVISAMMTNHPHDCPVCAEGGECHLQDMTVMAGHTSRQYSGLKRTYTNQNLGQFVGHEMNRCITCYRCVRFYKDYAGGTDFDVFGSSNHVYFGRQTDGPLESEFSGNLVEVCPTGVFTNKLFSAHFARKWDLQSAPSICTHCSVGCNISIGERYGSVRRVMNRFNSDINGYFLCDRGRFGIGFVNGKQRIKTTKGINAASPLQLSVLDVNKTLAHLKGQRFIGIGSARASLESNKYLQKMLGKDKFSGGFSSNEMAIVAQHRDILSQYPAPSLRDVEQSDFVLIIGEDITQTSPRMALAVRQTLRNASIEKAAGIGVKYWQDSAVRTYGGELLSPLFSLNSVPTKLDDVAEQALILTPDEIEHCLLALEQQLVSSFGLSEDEADDDVKDKVKVNESQQAFITALIERLLKAKKPLIIGGWSLQSASLLERIKQLTERLCSSEFIAAVQLAIMPPQCNSVGLFSLVDEQSLSTEQILEQLVSGKANSIICLEQELAHFTEQQIQTLRQLTKTIIVLDHSESKVSSIADIVMPVSPISEAEGHYVNYQGQVQKYFQVHAPVLPVQDSWRWLNIIESALFSNQGTSQQGGAGISSLEDLHNYLTDDESLSNDKEGKTRELFSHSKNNGRVARQTHRASGRTSQMANTSVHETKATVSNDANFNFSMEGLKPGTTSDMPFSWAPGWNSNQSISHYQTEANGELIEKKDQLILVFDECEKLLSRWPVISPEQKREDDKKNKLVFVQKNSMYQTDWQANFNPEFTQMFQGNQLSVSSHCADEQGWKDGQYLKLIFTSSASSDEIFHRALVTLHCDDNLPDNIINGNVFGLPLHVTDFALGDNNLKISEPDDQEIAQHQQDESARYQQAETDKKESLERLMVTDHTIPIRLVSGGLDDV
ncbi:MAG: NADH-quinone oxidoreductase subunit NuoG [Alteromonadaceae bacterium]|nr:NADH-quinone oxidoreductase subunit NuoG [Alteromonadaceae bacterium]